MNNLDLRKDPVILVLFGLVIICGLVVWAVLLLGGQPKQADTIVPSGPVLPVVTNPGQPDSLQASPLPLQSGTVSGQASSEAAGQLQPQTGLTPDQLKNLQ